MPRAKKAGYVKDRPVPCFAALPRFTPELRLAYRIFAPGIGRIEDLRAQAARLMRESHKHWELMQVLGIESRGEFADVADKALDDYEAEIIRMDEAQKEFDVTLKEKAKIDVANMVLEAGLHKENERLLAEDRLNSARAAGEEPTQRSSKKRGADDEPTTNTPISTKRARSDNAVNDNNNVTDKGMRTAPEENTKKPAERKEWRDGKEVVVITIDFSDNE